MHDLIYAVAAQKGSREAYRIFCHLKRYCEWVWTFVGVATVSFNDFLEIINKATTDSDDYRDFVERIFPLAVNPNNGIKKIIESRASRFGINHLWQMFGHINEEAKERGGFLRGMTKASFIRMARISRLAMIKDVSYYGYSEIKLTHCTKTLVVGYDGRIYTTDDLLTALDVRDIY